MPPPVRPAIPIVSGSNKIPDDGTIGESVLDFDEIPLLPAPAEEEESILFPFAAYDDPLQPIGGFAAFHKNLIYPEWHSWAGIEETVVVYAKISEAGEVADTRIFVPLGSSDYIQAAVATVKLVRWFSARQRNVPVAVWLSIPIRFKLK